MYGVPITCQLNAEVEFEIMVEGGPSRLYPDFDHIHRGKLGLQRVGVSGQALE